MNIFCGTFATELDNSLSFVNYRHSCFPQSLTCCAEAAGCYLRGGPRCARGHSRTSGWAKSAGRRGCPSMCPYLRLESARPSLGPASLILQSLLQLGRHNETVWVNAHTLLFQQRFQSSWKKEKKQKMLSKSGSPSRDCVPCIELKPFCKDEQWRWAHRFLWKQALNKFNGVGLKKIKEKSLFCMMWILSAGKTSAALEWPEPFETTLFNWVWRRTPVKTRPPKTGPPNLTEPEAVLKKHEILFRTHSSN